MNTDGMISKREEELLTALGYIVMRWNYAEWAARQILRMYVVADSLDDPAHLKVSAQMAKSIEDDLKTVALPKWNGVGRPYIEHLIVVYAIAREHRNHLVHGIYSTFDTRGPGEAQALLNSSMPKNKRTQLPTFTSISRIRPIANHFHDLANFAREVMIAFDKQGNCALNSDGTRVIDQLPSFITPLEPCEYQTT